MPTRYQRQRTAGWRAPEGAIYVGRGPGRSTWWSNPHRIGSDGVPDAATAVRLYREDLRRSPRFVALIRAELAGKDLLCWCKVGDPCHGDVLLAVAAGEEP